MTGRLYAIGVGPGDPELLTLKAARVLGKVGCICVPKGREEGASLALSIVRQAVNLDGKEIAEVFFPMQKTVKAHHKGDLDARWDSIARTVFEKLERGVDTAFITIGDPTIYSTFFYLYDRLLELHPGLRIEIIPGISSINASAARAAVSLGLGDDKIAVLPANYVDDLPAALSRFDTIVLMKAYKVFDHVVQVLDDAGLLERAVFVSRAGMPGEIVSTDLASLKAKDMDYFSLVIVRK